jgi:N6-adenosine-specific RNA methylase IME4
MEYRTIVADPPWRYDDGFSTRSHTNGVPNGPPRRYALPYPPMDVAAIRELRVADFAARDARIFLWTTNRYLPDAFGILAAWGFAYKQTLVWAKRDGFSGSVAPNAEFLVVAVKGSPRLLARWSSPVVSIARTREHSRKPDAFLDLVEQVSPGPYLELFARRQRLGWDTWGNEALEHVELTA